MLTAGAAPAPLALIIPGSGPTDSDGNNPLGVRASTYKLLAQDLAARGVATVRIDKRGMFASAAAVADPNAVTHRRLCSGRACLGRAPCASVRARPASG